jgi:hypothetical protein
MNVSGTAGVPASLPMPASTPASTHEATSGVATGRAAAPGSIEASGSTATGPATNAPVGELHIPGSKPAAKHTTEVKAHAEAPKPEALPPLKALTVDEIRAMLGVPALPRLSDGSTPASAPTSGTTPAVQAALQRYA